MQMKKIFLFILASILLTINLSGCGSNDEYVQMVRNGHMNMNPNVQVGKAFDQFFSKSDWKSFQSTDNERIVEFNGESEFFDQKVPVKIQFIVEGDSFSLHYMRLGELELDGITGVGALAEILNSYKR